MKSLQLREHKQIAEPRQYCLVRLIAFFGVCFFSIFFVSHRLGFRLNSLQQVIVKLKIKIMLGPLYNATVVTVVLVVVQVDGCISWLYLLTRA